MLPNQKLYSFRPQLDFMKKSGTLLCSVLVAAILAGAPAALAQQDDLGDANEQNSQTRTYAAIGTISNIQFEDGTPSWILSGGWKLRASLSGNDSGTATFVAATRMAMMDGMAMHMHRISDFNLESWSFDNSTATFNGTSTITLRDGPTEDVPISITIKNGGAVAIAIDSTVVDHFGSDPIYGLVLRSFDSMADSTDSGSQENDDVDSPTPTNATELNLPGLTRSSVDYYGNATGYLVYPQNGTDLPAVVMIHEWWGLNQNIKNEAEKLANEGYAVLAVDLYNGQIAEESDVAMRLSSEVRDNPEPAIENLQAAVSHLSGLTNVNSSRIASLGWCFGGGQSLQLALNTEQPLAATVIYYGNLVTEEEALSEIEWPVLGIFGSTDQSIPVQTVRDFEAALNTNEIQNEIHIYEGVGHAFANPSGDNYAPVETADAWTKTLDFLSEHV
jgi:carboxymethylenebutenolidase